MASIKCLLLVFILLLVDHAFARPVCGDTEGNKDNTQDESTGGCENHTGNVNCRGNINCLENLNNGASGNNVANENNVIYENDGGSSNNVDNGNIGGHKTQFGGHIVSNLKTNGNYFNNGNQGSNGGYGNYGGWSNNGGSGNNVGNKNNIKYVNNGGSSNNVENSNIGGHNYQFGGNIVSNTNSNAQASSWWNGSSESNFKADQGHESSASASASSSTLS
ncbi:N66 matrix protein-like isoform X3 [Leptopilina boulardi]|uniref:N66 matrix protein-like isoform X3 n=1 Tax=Leptopilina boulardi TaxID=63433 RepID=UPI0021F5049A|nr:N66 matrix protein-like isoform X3 [Leptopilina boulardi]